MRGSVDPGGVGFGGTASAALRRYSRCLAAAALARVGAGCLARAGLRSDAAAVVNAQKIYKSAEEKRAGALG